MNRKLCALLIAASLLSAALTACGESADNDETSKSNASFEDVLVSDESESSGRPALTDDQGFICELDTGVCIQLGVKTEEVLQSLGIVTNQVEAPSCLYDGTDKVYEIDGAFNVTSTIMEDGFEHITQIALINDSVSVVTPAGYMMIGSDKSILADAYGEPAENAFGMQVFNLSGGKLSVIVEEDRITSITYYIN